MKGDCSLIDVLEDYDAEQAEHELTMTNFCSLPEAVLKDVLMTVFLFDRQMDLVQIVFKTLKKTESIIKESFHNIP